MDVCVCVLAASLCMHRHFANIKHNIYQNAKWNILYNQPFETQKQKTIAIPFIYLFKLCQHTISCLYFIDLFSHYNHAQ